MNLTNKTILITGGSSGNKAYKLVNKKEHYQSIQ